MAGLILLNVAGVLVVVGALYDLLVPSVPSNHLAYLGADEGQLDPRFAALDLAMLRSIGGSLLAVGATALVLTNGPVRLSKWTARVSVGGDSRVDSRHGGFSEVDRALSGALKSGTNLVKPAICVKCGRWKPLIFQGFSHSDSAKPLSSGPRGRRFKSYRRNGSIRNSG
jgi:hypothetical protein